MSHLSEWMFRVKHTSGVEMGADVLLQIRVLWVFVAPFYYFWRTGPHFEHVGVTLDTRDENQCLFNDITDNWLICYRHGSDDSVRFTSEVNAWVHSVTQSYIWLFTSASLKQWFVESASVYAPLASDWLVQTHVICLTRKPGVLWSCHLESSSHYTSKSKFEI